MKHVSLSFAHAEDVFNSLHSAAFEPTAESDITGFRYDPHSEPFGTEQFLAWGMVDDRMARQVLSRNRYRTMYYLTTTFSEYGGKVVHANIGPNSDLDAVDVVSDSLFMKILGRIS
jgi:hypothetical protein